MFYYISLFKDKWAICIRPACIVVVLVDRNIRPPVDMSPQFRHIILIVR